MKVKILEVNHNRVEVGARMRKKQLEELDSFLASQNVVTVQVVGVEYFHFVYIFYKD